MGDTSIVSPSSPDWYVYSLSSCFLDLTVPPFSPLGFTLQHTPNLVRPPFHLVATAVDGYVSIHLPASFHGPVTVNVNTTGDLTEHISLSNALKENSFILRESGMSRCYFVGEVGGWSKSDPLWKGDKVDVWLNSGRVRFQMFGEKDWDLVRKLTWKFT